MAVSTHQSTNDMPSSPRFEPLLTIIGRIANGERVRPQITMRYEMLRFCTMRSFPKENKPFITRLAQAGFYYANSGDELVCYCCGRRRCNWRETDVPMDVHKEMNPNCRFLLNNLEVNVPIRFTDEEQSANHSSTESSSRSPSDGHLESSAENSSRNNLQSTPVHVSSESDNSLPASHRTEQTSSNEDNADTSVTAVSEEQLLENGLSTLTVVSGDRQRNQSFSARAVALPVSRYESQSSIRIAGEARPAGMPKYPKYSSKTVRLTSFVDCGEIVVTRESLAEAGFFYAGFGDCVRCFQCGVGLRHWSEEDDPWIEHSRWSKECSFVRQVKGGEFVNLVQMAVQYSQNQNGREQALSEDTHGAAGQQTLTGVDETDRLMHTDAAQSVLEMGYLPDIIKRAIRAVLESAGRESLIAANLMEKILEIEELDSLVDSHVNNTDANQHDEPLIHVSTSESRNIQQTPESSNTERPEVDESKRNTSNAEGRGGEMFKENQTPDEANTVIPDDPTSQSHGTDVTREATGDSGDNQKSAIQSQEPASPVALLTGYSTSTSAVTAATNRESTAARRAHLLEQRRLKQENETLKQQSVCQKCKKKDVCIVFLPCGHLITCEDCASSIKYCTVDKCGKYIKGTVRTYMS